MAVVVAVVGGAAARSLADRNSMVMVAEVEEGMVTIRRRACVLVAFLLPVRKVRNGVRH
jgi:hypothetical protein